MNNKEKGRYFENLAENYLKKNGYKLIGKNFFSRYGEIDIIALDKDNNLIFIEVKGRNSLNFGAGEESITQKKIKSIIKTAEIFLKTNPNLEFSEIRFDVISIYKDKINHIKNAFDVRE